MNDHIFDTRPVNKRILLPGNLDHSFRIEYKKTVDQVIFTCGVSPFEGIGKIDNSKIENFRALLDTGSNDTCITRRAALKLNLTSVGKRDSFGSTGAGKSEVYVINLHLPWKIIIPMETVESFDHPDFDIIIGMNIFSKGNLSIENSSGKTVFQFKQIFV